MHRSSRRSSTRNTKNFASAAKTAYRHTDRAASSLGKWIITDHTGLTRTMIEMPNMGLWDTCRYILTNFVITVIGAIFSGL